VLIFAPQTAGPSVEAPGDVLYSKVLRASQPAPGKLGGVNHVTSLDFVRSTDELVATQLPPVQDGTLSPSSSH
jgi:hypothetical protein